LQREKPTLRIPCPYCGPRDVAEFSYSGEALPRPDAGNDGAMFDYVYLRDNPAGPHRGYWYHGAGCRSWLLVTRDTRTHEILDVAYADAERSS
jgi:heterotetrameric sarcosine oxidase delta subunit